MIAEAGALFQFLERFGDVPDAQLRVETAGTFASEAQAERWRAAGYGTPPLADRANETRKKLYKLLFAASDAFAWQSEYLDGETSAARKRDALALLAELEREAENYPSI